MVNSSRLAHSIAGPSAARGNGLPERRVLRAMLIGIIALALGLAARLVYVQLINRDHFLAVAARVDPPHRPAVPQPGAIRDRRGRIVADSVVTASLKVDPKLLRRYEDVGEASRYLNSVLGIPVEQIEQKLNSERDFAYLERRVPLDTAEQVLARRLAGITQDLEYKRVYPEGEVGCHLLGYFSSDHRPLGGLERRYRFVLQGREGTPLVNQDAWGRRIVGMENQPALPAVPGKDLVLTVDWDLQRVVDDALARCWQREDPDEATAVVMDAGTGAILALASRPNYDPNTIASAGTGVARVDIPPRNLVNLSVTRAYEPGSTFKVLLAAAALDSGAVSLTDTFYCPGTTEVGGKPLKCWGRWASNGGHGRLNMAGMIAKSCNICAALTATKVGAERYVKFLRRCGLGAYTRAGFPGEAAGSLRDSKKMYERDVANMGFGQGVAVTDLQLVAAVSAVVNGGVLMQPYVVDRVLNADGSVYRQVNPVPIRRVCSEETSRIVRSLIRGAVEHGTGLRAQIEGVAVGGKTGTAQIWDSKKRKWLEGQHIVSFVLVAPLDATPRFVILVTARVRGENRHGSTVAAPVAREIAVYMLQEGGPRVPETSARPDGT